MPKTTSEGNGHIEKKCEDSKRKHNKELWVKKTIVKYIYYWEMKQKDTTPLLVDWIWNKIEIASNEKAKVSFQV